MKPLRIVLAPSAYYPHVGGIEELTRQLARSYDSHGHRVSVLTNLWPDGVRASEVLDGVSVARFRFPLPASQPAAVLRFLASSPRAAARLLGYLRKTKPDIVHVIGAGPQSVYLALLTHLAGPRLVFTAQGELTFDAEDVFKRSMLLRAGLRRILRAADAVTACSAFVLRDLEGFASIRSAAQVVPNGVNPSEFDDVRPADVDAPYVLAVGRLVPQKGFDVLLDALTDRRLCGLQLVLAGDGPMRAALEEQAHRIGIASNVQFVGSVGRAEVARLLRGASAFAFPSRGEPFGIALLEAMAAGVPAVATNAGGIPEFATDGENALLVDPGRSSPLADAIARLWRDEELRSRLALAGEETARGLSWERISRRYEDIYAAALAGQAR